MNEVKVENELLNKHIEKVEEELYETLIKFDKACEERITEKEKAEELLKRVGFEQLKEAILKMKIEQLLKKVGFEQLKGAILKLKIEQLLKRVGFEQLKGAILKLKIEEMARSQIPLDYRYENKKDGISSLDN